MSPAKAASNMRVVTIPELQEAFVTGRKILVLVENRTIADQAFQELGGMRKLLFSSVHIYDGVHNARSDAGGQLTILPKGNEWGLCGYHADLIVLQNETFLTEEEMQMIVRPLLVATNKDIIPELVKIQ